MPWTPGPGPTDGDDTFAATVNNDTADGGLGNDTLNGGAGDDTLSGSGGDDVVAGGSGTDILNGGDGNDRLTDTGSVEGFAVRELNDTLDGGAGDDVLDAGEGFDILRGGAGDDQLSGGRGEDRLDVGVGSDTADGGSVPNSSFRPEEDLLVADYSAATSAITFGTLTGTLATGYGGVVGDGTAAFRATFTAIEGFEVTGGSADDTFVTGDGDDALSGGEGNDVFDARGGSNVLRGGPGDDIYVLGLRFSSSDFIFENLDGGIDEVRAFDGHTLSANVENLTSTATSGFLLTLRGNALNNIIRSSAVSEQLRGQAGDDQLFGGGGGDRLDGGLGDDVVSGDGGEDLLELDYSSATAPVTGGLLTGDLATGFAGVFTDGTTALRTTFTGVERFQVRGGFGNDSLTTGAGADTLFGVFGIDTLVGGGGNDTYVVNSAAHLTVELEDGGYDDVSTPIAEYTLQANVEALRGDFPGQRLIGNALDNLIEGDDGDDTLEAWPATTCWRAARATI